MSDLKTLPTDAPVEEYLANIDNTQRQQDARQTLEIMRDITGEKPVMWGPSIVGFGKIHYKYATGREGDTVAVGFSARKQALTLYGVIYYDQNVGRIKELGNVKHGKGCLYIKKLSDLDLDVLKDMIRFAYENRNKLSA